MISRPGESFPPQARLRDSREFSAVYSHARRIADGFFHVAWSPNETGAARLGLAVSRKCARRAVDRQRIKRIVRESFRRCRASLPAVDIIVSCRPAAARSSNEVLRQSLERHWSKLHT